MRPKLQLDEIRAVLKLSGEINDCRKGFKSQYYAVKFHLCFRTGIKYISKKLAEN
jgi:hypothetical protein